MKIFVSGIVFLFSLSTGFCSNDLSYRSLSGFQQTGTYEMVIRNFSGEIEGNDTRLSWEVSKAVVDLDCRIERSTDGINFTTVATIFIQEGFDGGMNFTDKDVKDNNYFYRLCLYKSGYYPLLSNIVSIRRLRQDSYSVVNPFSDQLTVRGNFEKGLALKIELTDISGNLKLIRQYAPASTASVISIPAGEVAPGMYILRITSLHEPGNAPLISRCIFKNDR